MKYQGFVGPSYNLKSPNMNCQRSINLYPEVDQSGTGKEGQVMYLKSTPGLEKIMEVGTGPIRMILVDSPKISEFNPTNRVFIVSGSEMYKASLIAGVWTYAKLGDLTTNSGPVIGVAIQGDLGSAVFVDGEHSYLYIKYDSGDAVIREVFGKFNEFGYPAVPNCTYVTWIDGFFIYNEGGTEKFYVSNWNSMEFNPLSFASSEGDPDYLLAMISKNRNLWLFNERTTEVWANTGNATFPFERISGGFIEKGIVAPSSLQKIDDKLLWLGRDSTGEGIVFMAEGLSPQRVSTHAVEYAISTYSDISKATAYVYQRGGHSFYVLNFAEGTWVYDISTNLWHERLSLEDGQLVRNRPNVGAYFPFNGSYLVGDYQSNKIYLLKDGHFKNDTLPLARVRIGPNMSSGGNRLYFKSMQLDMETGVGLDGSVQGSDPQVMMQFSNDGGHTWSSELWASAGKKIGGIGDFKKRVKWDRLGSAFNRIFKIMVTDPVDVTISGADLDVEGGR